MNLKLVPKASPQSASNCRQEWDVDSVDREEHPTNSKSATKERLTELNSAPTIIGESSIAPSSREDRCVEESSNVIEKEESVEPTPSQRHHTLPSASQSHTSSATPNASKVALANFQHSGCYFRLARRSKERS